jgi:hypothetical protein
LTLKPLLAGLLLTAGFTGTALAGPQPNPPPSGVVVHLFGQNSVMSNVLPTSAATALGVPAGTTTSSSGEPAAEPTLGDIAHQMFVVGDPEHPTKPAPGKTAPRPAN